MPSLGADMDAGTITKWMVRPGDRVRRGDIVAVVQTDKSDIEVEIFEDGVVQDLAVPEGVRVSVGTTLAHISLAAPSPVASTSAPGVPTNGAALEAPAVGSSPTGPAPGYLVESPLVRRLAHQRGVDLARVTGTGEAGVLKRDVRAIVPSAEGQVAAPRTPAGEKRQRTMQRAIGALMARSKREVPHYYLDSTIDLSEASAWLERTNLERAVADRLVMASLLFCATARAVVRVPEMNGFFIDGDFVASAAVNLGVAISQRGG